MNDGNKRLLVPVVAVMLCVMAVVGVGYAAINSSVTNTENTVSTETIEVHMKYRNSEGSFTWVQSPMFNKEIQYNVKDVNGTNKYTWAKQSIAHEDLYLDIEDKRTGVTEVVVAPSISGTTNVTLIGTMKLDDENGFVGPTSDAGWIVTLTNGRAEVPINLEIEAGTSDDLSGVPSIENMSITYTVSPYETGA